MTAALTNVAKGEKFDIPESTASEIIKDSRGNLRKALLVLEAFRTQSCVKTIIASSPCSPNPNFLQNGYVRRGYDR